MSFVYDDEKLKLITPEGQKALGEIETRIRELTEISGGVKIIKLLNNRYNDYLVLAAVYRLVERDDVYIQQGPSMQDSFAIYRR